MKTSQTQSFACISCFVVLAAWSWDWREWPWNPSNDRNAANQAEIQRKEAEASRQEAEAKSIQAEAQRLQAEAIKYKAVKDAQIAQQKAEEARLLAARSRKEANYAHQHADEAQREAQRDKRFYKVGLVVLGVIAFGSVIVGLYYRFRRRPTIVQQVTKQEVVVRSPAHSILDDSFVIDGANIARGYGQGQPPSLLVLLTLLRVLLERGATFKCVFDANTSHIFREAALPDQADAYRSLCQEFPNWFIEVLGGVQADREILAYAHSRGCRIISNDRYRDYADTYPWTQTEPDRRISGQAHSGHVFVTPLGIDEAVMNDLSQTLFSFRALLNSRIPQIA